MTALRNEVDEEQFNLKRLKAELDENRKALQGLQEEIPERIVSSQRLSQLRLAIKHQQAATDALRFKQKARSKVGVMQELLAAWHDVIPPHVRKVLLASFDLQLTSRRPSGGGGGLTNGHGAADQRRDSAFGAGRSSLSPPITARSGRGFGTDAIAADAATGYAESSSSSAVLVSSMCMIRPVQASSSSQRVPPPWRMAGAQTPAASCKRCRPRRRRRRRRRRALD